jgi:hypothetical protein
VGAVDEAGPDTYSIRHTRSGTGPHVARATFDAFIGGRYIGGLVALGPEQERELSRRLALAFPGALYGAATGPKDSAEIDAAFGYGRPD